MAVRGAQSPLIKNQLNRVAPQTNIAAQIIQQEGDYILSLKGDQGNLHKGVKEFLKQAEVTDWEGIEYTSFETTEAGHHRTERRQVWAVPINQLPDLPNAQKWKGKRQCGDGETGTTAPESTNHGGVFLHQ